MGIENGIDWLKAIYEAWPALCWIGGWTFGREIYRHYSDALLRAQKRQIHNLQQLNAKLADDNERMMEYMRYLRENNNASN